MDFHELSRSIQCEFHWKVSDSLKRCPSSKVFGPRPKVSESTDRTEPRAGVAAAWLSWEIPPTKTEV